MFGVEKTHDACDVEAPITTLGYVFEISKVLHEAVACLCVLCESKSWFANSLAEAKIGKTGSYYMKSRVAITSF